MTTTQTDTYFLTPPDRSQLPAISIDDSVNPTEASFTQSTSPHERKGDNLLDRGSGKSGLKFSREKNSWVAIHSPTGTDVEQKADNKPKKKLLANPFCERYFLERRRAVPPTVSYLCGTNETTKAGKVVLYISSAFLMISGAVAFGLGVRYHGPEFCIIEPTLPIWLSGEGVMNFVVGIALSLKIKSMPRPFRNFDNFLMVMILVVLVVWLLFGTIVLLHTALMSDRLQYCDKYLFYIFVSVTLLIWFELLLASFLTALRKYQLKKARRVTTHFALLRNVVLLHENFGMGESSNKARQGR